jgi:hypothetical protein
MYLSLSADGANLLAENISNDATPTLAVRAARCVKRTNSMSIRCKVESYVMFIVRLKSFSRNYLVVMSRGDKRFGWYLTLSPPVAAVQLLKHIKKT